MQGRVGDNFLSAQNFLFLEYRDAKIVSDAYWTIIGNFVY